MKRYLAEKLSYDKLFRASTPERVLRSFHVKGPPLEIDSYQDAVYYAFNFKSFPSTTGLRHRGYIKFLRPKLGGQKPLQHLDCVIDCTCPDYKYRWAWANKQRGASRVGTNSLNQSLNRAPRITNPTSRPGMCKHLLAAREYIYGLLSAFPNSEPDTSNKLNKLTKFAQKRWANMPAEMAAARDRERRIAAARNMRNAGQPAPMDLPPAADQADNEEEPRQAGDDEAYRDVRPPPAPELVALPAPPESYASRVKPPSQRGRNLPNQSQAASTEPVDRLQNDKDKNKSDERATRAGFKSAAAYNAARRQGLGDSFGYQSTKNETNTVVNVNGQKNMSISLVEAKRIIQELEQDELARLRTAGQDDQDTAPPDGDQFQDGEDDMTPVDDMGGGDAPIEGDMGGDMGGDLPPSEPPVSDTAVGADSGGQLALSLLREIRDFVGQMAAAVAPAPEAEEIEDVEGGGGAPIGGEIEDGAEIPVEDPAEEAEEAEEEEEDEDESEREEAEEKDRELA